MKGRLTKSVKPLMVDSTPAVAHAMLSHISPATPMTVATDASTIAS